MVNASGRYLARHRFRGRRIRHGTQRARWATRRRSREIVGAPLRSYETQAVVGNPGNVSACTRFGMLVTPTGASATTVRPETFVEMTLDDDVEGNNVPSSEWQMPAELYRAAPDAMVIVHTRSDHATALASLNRPLPAFSTVGLSNSAVRMSAARTTQHLAHRIWPGLRPRRWPAAPPACWPTTA